MKNLKLLVLLVSISLVSFSCDSDDDSGNGGSSADSKLIFGDTEYQLKAGTIENYGDYYVDGVFNFDIALLSSEISIVDGYTEPTDAVYSGVYFELFTLSEDDIAEGVYTFWRYWW